MSPTAAPGNIASTQIGTPPVYGQVTVDGLNYIERPQLFVTEATIQVPNQVLTNQRLTLPAVADFLLKGLVRDITIPGSPISHNRLFRFRIVNADGTTWFFTGALGVFDDRVVHSLCFGSGQFPFPVIPPVPVHASGSLVYEVEDMGVNAGPGTWPYTIHFGFIGAYLIPAVQAGSPVGPVAYPGGQAFITDRGA